MISRLVFFPDGLEDQEEVDGEESPGGDAEAAEGLAGGRAQLRVVVRVEGDDADQDEQRGAHYAQQRLLKSRTTTTLGVNYSHDLARLLTVMRKLHGTATNFFVQAKVPFSFLLVPRGNSSK